MWSGGPGRVVLGCGACIGSWSSSLVPVSSCASAGLLVERLVNYNRKRFHGAESASKTCFLVTTASCAATATPS